MRLKPLRKRMSMPVSVLLRAKRLKNHLHGIGEELLNPNYLTFPWKHFPGAVSPTSWNSSIHCLRGVLLTRKRLRGIWAQAIEIITFTAYALTASVYGFKYRIIVDKSLLTGYLSYYIKEYALT